MVLLELAQQINLIPKYKAGTHGGEYGSECPACGGEDRFFIQPNRKMKNCLGYYKCRQCEISGDSIQFCIDFLGDTFQDAVQRIGAKVSSVSNTYKVNIFKPAPLIEPPLLWLEKAKSFVEWAHKQIWDYPAQIDDLNKRGISDEAIRKYKIGYNPKTYRVDKITWGLPLEYDENKKPKNLWLPKGIVIPTIEPNQNVIRLKIRRDDWRQGDEIAKYIAISGSMNGLNIIGNMSHKAMLVVESELDAYAADYIAGDYFFCVSVGSSLKNPDNVVDNFAKKVNKLLICHDNDEAGRSMLLKWRRLYNHAKAMPTPIGKDIGEAFELGLDIREWLQKIIKN